MSIMAAGLHRSRSSLMTSAAANSPGVSRHEGVVRRYAAALVIMLVTYCAILTAFIAVSRARGIEHAGRIGSGMIAAGVPDRGEYRNT